MINKLPRDIYIKILSMLDYKSNLNAGLVSRTLFTQTSSMEVWKNITELYIWEKFKVKLMVNNSEPNFFKKFLKNTIYKEQMTVLENRINNNHLKLEELKSISRKTPTAYSGSSSNTMSFSLSHLDIAIGFANLGSSMIHFFLSPNKLTTKEKAEKKMLKRLIQDDTKKHQILKDAYNNSVSCAQELIPMKIRI